MEYSQKSAIERGQSQLQFELKKSNNRYREQYKYFDYRKFRISLMK